MITPRLKEFVRAMSLEGLAIPDTTHDAGGNTSGSTDFAIEDLKDFWRITGVSYRNGIYQVDVSKVLLPSGTQDEQAQRRKEALTKDSAYTPSYPEFYGVIDTVHKNREGPYKDQIEAARTSLSELVEGRWLMTLTRIRYAPHGQDVVIHNYGQDDAYETHANVVGPDGVITEPGTNAGAALQALLGTQQSPQKIDQVYRWFRNTAAYLLRVNSRPRSVDERVAGFFADSDEADLYCRVGLLFSVASLGVRARKIG